MEKLQKHFFKARAKKKTDSPLCHSIDDRKLVSEEEKRLSNYSKVNRTIKDDVQR